MLDIMKKILIIGAKGNLGKQLVDVFRNANNVIGLDREDVDVTKKRDIYRKILSNKPGVIINATGYTMVDRCEEEKEFLIAKKVNMSAVGYLAELATKINATLIHYSTDHVFNGKKRGGYTEVDRPDPINNYGKTKLWGERMVLNMKKNGLRFYLIRTSKLFGPKGINGHSKPSFFDIMLDLAKRNKELKVVDQELSCFTYTPDLASSTKFLLDGNYEYGIYHIVNEEAATWYEGALNLFKIVKIKNVKLIPIKSGEFSRLAKRPNYSILLNTKFPKLRNYKEALKDFYENSLW